MKYAKKNQNELPPPERLELPQEPLQQVLLLGHIPEEHRTSCIPIAKKIFEESGEKSLEGCIAYVLDLAKISEIKNWEGHLKNACENGFWKAFVEKKEAEEKQASCQTSEKPSKVPNKILDLIPVQHRTSCVQMAEKILEESGEKCLEGCIAFVLKMEKLNAVKNWQTFFEGTYEYGYWKVPADEKEPEEKQDSYQTPAPQAPQNQAPSPPEPQAPQNIQPLLKLIPPQHRADLTKAVATAVGKNGADYVKRNIEYSNSRNPNNYTGYLVTAFESDYGKNYDPKSKDYLKAQAVARSCNAIHGNCPGNWSMYKNDKTHGCYWCVKFEKERNRSPEETARLEKENQERRIKEKKEEEEKKRAGIERNRKQNLLIESLTPEQDKQFAEFIKANGKTKIQRTNRKMNRNAQIEAFMETLNNSEEG